ncbi:MAG: diguanylate cyclase [Planctomycetaceae bacterium]
MPRLSSIHRIVLGLVGLSVSVLLVAGLLGFVPDVRPREIQARQAFCESTAVAFMEMAPRMSESTLTETLQRMATRHPDLIAIGIRREAGDVVMTCGNADDESGSGRVDAQNQTLFELPIEADGRPWGQMEFRFHSVPGVSVFGWYLRPDFLLVVFVGCALFATFSLYLQKVLKHLSPNKVVPNRVREALNSLAEGLLVLDRNQAIVLANSSFAASTGMNPEDLIGLHPNRFGFQCGPDGGEKELPWDITSRESRSVQGTLLTYDRDGQELTFSVSTVPVRDEKNLNRGVVASFENVTVLQEKQKELRNALVSLRTSSEEIRTQNRELEWLATRDTLTGCLNRRSFFKAFEAAWSKAHRQQSPLAAIMLDIDHFKKINDTAGHIAGDDVLRQVANAVHQTVDPDDVVCRYGGEEFTIMLEGSSIDEAELMAEKCRLAIKALRISGLRVTASFGVSSVCQAADNIQTLLDQADKSLYAAKRSGRDRVVRWDRAQSVVGEDTEMPTAGPQESRGSAQDGSAIHFHAVAALTTVLAHRDQEAAIHSRRVADMCVATAEGLLSMKQCYVLEIAALLHDIGKLGIPDAILHKRGPLTAEERALASRYNQLSVDIVRGSFGQPVLNEIVEQHAVWYDMSNADRGAGPDQRPSISARILSIANAYDTMTSDSAWRTPMSRSEAFAELRACAGTQFDPELVERFIGAVRLRIQTASASTNASRESALSIGLLLERLVNALDKQDLRELLPLTQRIQKTADDHSLTEIAKLCRSLNHALSEDEDLIEVMQLAGSLLDMCRSTQAVLLSSTQKSDRSPGERMLANAGNTIAVARTGSVNAAMPVG